MSTRCKPTFLRTYHPRAWAWILRVLSCRQEKSTSQNEMELGKSQPLDTGRWCRAPTLSLWNAFLAVYPLKHACRCKGRRSPGAQLAQVLTRPQGWTAAAVGQRPCLNQLCCALPSALIYVLLHPIPLKNLARWSNLLPRKAMRVWLLVAEPIFIE